MRLVHPQRGGKEASILPGGDRPQNQSWGNTHRRRHGQALHAEEVTIGPGFHHREWVAWRPPREMGVHIVLDVPQKHPRRKTHLMV